MKIEGNQDQVHQIIRLLRRQYQVWTNDQEGNYSFVRSDHYPDMHIQVKIIDNPSILT